MREGALTSPLAQSDQRALHTHKHTHADAHMLGCLYVHGCKPRSNHNDIVSGKNDEKRSQSCASLCVRACAWCRDVLKVFCGFVYLTKTAFQCVFLIMRWPLRSATHKREESLYVSLFLSQLPHYPPCPVHCSRAAVSVLHGL